MSGTELPPPAGETDVATLGTALEPVLRRTCEGRLGGVEWFRSTWQRGGAATAYGVWTFESGSTADVMIKLPVGPQEHGWTTSLGAVGPQSWDDAHNRSLCTPRVMAWGDSLGDYDLAWLVLERLEGHRSQSQVDKASLTALLRAAARLHERAATVRPVDGTPELPDWAALFAKARQAVKDNDLEDSQNWNKAIKHAQKALPALEVQWKGRPIETWCHGDLHPGNAMTRPGDESNCVLIDLALMHPGHWIEDAIYLERLYWGHTELLDGVKPVSVLARSRRDLGLDTSGDYARLANIRRVLMASCVPAFLAREGNPRYVAHALATIDRLLPQLT